MIVVTPSPSNKKPPLAPVFLSLRLLKCAHQEENAWILKPLSQSWPVPKLQRHVSQTLQEVRSPAFSLPI